VLEASVLHLDGRVRSRLTRARHAALNEVQRAHRRRAIWWSLVPVATVGAAAVIAIVLWSQRPEGVALQMNVPTAQVPTAQDAQGAEGAAPQFASTSGDEIDFLLGEDLFADALQAEPAS
jgi:hypothetical protein